MLPELHVHYIHGSHDNCNKLQNNQRVRQYWKKIFQGIDINTRKLTHQPAKTIMPFFQRKNIQWEIIYSTVFSNYQSISNGKFQCSIKNTRKCGYYNCLWSIFLRSEIFPILPCVFEKKNTKIPHAILDWPAVFLQFMQVLKIKVKYEAILNKSHVQLWRKSQNESLLWPCCMVSFWNGCIKPSALDGAHSSVTRRYHLYSFLSNYIRF